MARRDWQKLARQSLAQRDHRQGMCEKHYHSIEKHFLGKDIWQIGKHRGKKITQLPLHYLIWASENLMGLHKGTADRELIRRYQAQNQHTRLAGHS